MGSRAAVSTLAYKLSSFCDENSLDKGPKRPQICTVSRDFARVAKSGLKLPFESSHLDFPAENAEKTWKLVALDSLSSFSGRTFQTFLEFSRERPFWPLWKANGVPKLKQGNAPGTFLQTPAPALASHGCKIFISTGLGLGTLKTERAQLLPAPALNKNRSTILKCPHL